MPIEQKMAKSNTTKPSPVAAPRWSSDSLNKTLRIRISSIACIDTSQSCDDGRLFRCRQFAASVAAYGSIHFCGNPTTLAGTRRILTGRQKVISKLSVALVSTLTAAVQTGVMPETRTAKVGAVPGLRNQRPVRADNPVRSARTGDQVRSLSRNCPAACQDNSQTKQTSHW